MANDRYGNTLYIGDRVAKVGSSDEFFIEDITYNTGEELLSLIGNHWRETRVHPHNVIKK